MCATNGKYLFNSSNKTPPSVWLVLFVIDCMDKAEDRGVAGVDL